MGSRGREAGRAERGGVNVSTDVQILTAARDLYAATEAVKAADAAKLAADRVQSEASRVCEEARKRLAGAQARLLALSTAKPAEPAPRVEVPKAEPAKVETPAIIPPQGGSGTVKPKPSAVPNLSAPRR